MKPMVVTLVFALFSGILCEAAAPPQTRIVCKSGCDYAEPADAIDSILDSAVDKPYTVFVYPGIYTKPITMKSYVGIVGYEPASTYILGTDGGSQVAINIPTGVNGTSFRGLTIGGVMPFSFSTGDGGSPISMTVENCTVGLFAGPIQSGSSKDCWYDTSLSGGHNIYASNVTLNVSMDCIMPSPNSRFIGKNLTVYSAPGGITGFIRPAFYGGWYVDIDGITHTSALTGGVDPLFRWIVGLQTTSGSTLKIRNAVWSVATTGTTAKTQTCVDINDVSAATTTADFEFTNVSCSLSASDSSQTLYGYRIASDSHLANYRVHVQGGSIVTSGPGPKADVFQDAMAGGFVFEMGSVRNGGTFAGAGTVSAISFHP